MICGKKLTSLFSNIFIVIIRVYQYTISPLLGERCRFYASCSQYALDSIRSLGVVRGIYLTVKRILRCHPWHEGGYDPVPKRDKEC